MSKIEFVDPVQTWTLIAIPSAILIGVSIMGFYLSSTITCDTDANCKEKENKFRQGWISLLVILILIVIGAAINRIPFTVKLTSRELDELPVDYSEYDFKKDKTYVRQQPLISLNRNVYEQPTNFIDTWTGTVREAPYESY